MGNKGTKEENDSKRPRYTGSHFWNGTKAITVIVDSVRLQCI